MDETSRSIDDKNETTDKVLKLTFKEGSTTGSHGLVDKRLVTGENKLHAVMDKQTTLWHFYYEHGILPPQLVGFWTSFFRLKKHADEYFNKRNIYISEVI